MSMRGATLLVNRKIYLQRCGTSTAPLWLRPCTEYRKWDWVRFKVLQNTFTGHIGDGFYRPNDPTNTVEYYALIPSGPPHSAHNNTTTMQYETKKAHRNKHKQNYAQW